MIIFVTGTNTDVGKTIATAALALNLADAEFTVAVLKPLQTGEPEGSGDATTVEKLTGIPTAELVRYPEPLAPNLAARRAEMRQLSLQECVAAIVDAHAKLEKESGGDSGSILLVEGAGGLLVRLADDWTLANVAVEVAKQRRNAGMIVVTSLGLGSLNSAELTVEAARNRGINVLGLIGGSLAATPDLATTLNLEELPVVTGVPLLGCVPAGCGSSTQETFRQTVAGIFELSAIVGAMPES